MFSVLALYKSLEITSVLFQGYDGEMGSSTGTLRSTRFGGSVASLESSIDPFSKSPRVKRKQLMQEEEMDNMSRLDRKLHEDKNTNILVDILLLEVLEL